MDALTSPGPTSPGPTEQPFSPLSPPLNDGLSFLHLNNSTDALPTLQFPAEIIFKILEFQLHQIMQNNTASVTTNTAMFIKSNLSVCRVFYRCVCKLVYKYCCFKTPQTFDIFLNSVTNHRRLGHYVRVLDFQEFTSIGLGRTGKMNKEIQMVTSTTILKCLQSTPNLVEFLASENIKDDLDTKLLNYLFNEMKFLRAVDFCGCSGEIFTSNFDSVIIKRPGIMNITDLSFHDCTDLPSWCLEKMLVNLPNLKKLDLTHTQITSKTLNLIPQSVKLTHLSLAYCIQLTTRELISFFINHPAITSNQLVWLNMQCDVSTNTLLSNNQVTFLLKMFDCDFQYLNLGGLPITYTNLLLIKKKFLNLKALALARCSFTQQEIINFLSPPTTTTTDTNTNGEAAEYYQQLQFLDLSNNNNITRWSLDNPQFLNCSSSLVAFEFSMKIINDIESIGGKLIYRTHGKTIWRAYDSGGRRGWLFKISNVNPDNSSQLGLVEYDIETGQKKFKILRNPEFLKFVNRKISLSMGVLSDADEVFGDFERGIYKYYGMKM